MKEWPAGTCTAIGRSMLTEHNLHIYRIPTFAGDSKAGS